MEEIQEGSQEDGMRPSDSKEKLQINSIADLDGTDPLVDQDKSDANSTNE